MITNALDLLEALERLQEDNIDLEKLMIVVEASDGDCYEEGIELSVQKTRSLDEVSNILNILAVTT